MPGHCLTFRTIDRLFVVRQNENAPTDSDWQAFLREIKRLRPRLGEVRAMVFSDGGGPTAEQRKMLAAVMDGKEIQTAVICDKGVIRFVVATIGLFNKLIRTYSWRDTPQAYAWLGLTAAESAKVEQTVLDLNEAVGSVRRGSVRAAADEPSDLEHRA